MARTETCGTESAGASPSAEEIEKRDGLLFELVMGALYHRARTNWFAGLYRGGLFLNILLGTSAAAAIARAGDTGAAATAIAAAMVTAANLAFDFAGQARRHNECRRTYHDLAAELEELGPDHPCARLRARMIRASGEEPATFEAALCEAFNGAIRSLGRDRDGEFVLSRGQNIFRHLWPQRGTVIRTRRELREAAEQARSRGAPC